MKSAYTNTHDLKNIEILVTVDSDDDVKGYRKLTDEFDRVELIVKKHSDNLSDDYYNMMARRSIGDYIWALNDDVVIKEKDWDEKMYDTIVQEGGDGRIFYGRVGATAVARTSFSSFPILSREAVEAMGFFHDPRLYTYSADIYLYHIYRHARAVIDMTQYEYVEHFKQNDEVSASMVDRCAKYGNGHNIDYEPLIQKLFEEFRERNMHEINR